MKHGPSQGETDPFGVDGGDDLSNKLGGRGAGRWEWREGKTIGDFMNRVGQTNELEVIARINVGRCSLREGYN